VVIGTAIAISRVSTNRQDRNYSHSEQIAGMRQFAAARGLELVKIYSDTDSGTLPLEQRPELYAAYRKYIEKARIDVAIFYDTDRIGRKISVIKQILESIFKAQVTVAVVKKDRLYDNFEQCYEDLYFDCVAAELRHDDINRKSIPRQKLAIEMGSMMIRPIYGYKNQSIPISRDGRTVNVRRPLVVMEQIRVVRKVYNMFLAGASKLAIIAHLNEIQAPNMKDTPAKKAKWTYVGVSAILRNALKYAGQPYTYEWTVGKKEFDQQGNVLSPPVKISDSYNPIIDLPTAIRVLETLDAYEKRPSHKKRQEAYPFAGLLRCHCGKTASVIQEQRRNRETGKVEKGKYYSFCTSKHNYNNYRHQGRPMDFKVCHYSMNVQRVTEALGAYLTIDCEVSNSCQFLTEVGKCMENYAWRKKELDYLTKTLSHLNGERSAMVRDYGIGASAATIKVAPIAQVRQVDAERREIVKAIGCVEEIVRAYELVLERFGMTCSAINLDSLPERTETMSEDDYCRAVLERGQGVPATTGPLGNKVGHLKAMLSGEMWAEVNKAMKNLGLLIEVDHSIRHRERRRESIRIHFNSD
jgi:DNA invertase Pin-like site-specific DNA recombinase